jgi:hypothetical protein
VTLLQEIHAWSKNLAAQQDAIARLYASRTLTPADLDDLYALVQSRGWHPCCRRKNWMRQALYPDRCIFAAIRV